MKKLAYFIAALVSLTSCTMDQEDIPTPINETSSYERYEGSQTPQSADELELRSKGTAHVELFQEEEEEDLMDRDNTRKNHEFPEASLQSVKTIQSNDPLVKAKYFPGLNPFPKKEEKIHTVKGYDDAQNLKLIKKQEKKGTIETGRRNDLHDTPDKYEEEEENNYKKYQDG